jgi:hypothetical protein
MLSLRKLISRVSTFNAMVDLTLFDDLANATKEQQANMVRGQIKQDIDISLGTIEGCNGSASPSKQA